MSPSAARRPDVHAVHSVNQFVFSVPDLDWPAADHPPEDSLYVWGPGLPDDFITNRELA